MRIGIARSMTDSASGGVFQYEMVFLRALGELANRYPEEFVYVCYHSNDLAVLASVGALHSHGIPVALLSKSPPMQRPPEDFLVQRPQTPLALDPNIVNFDYAASDALKKNGIDLLLVLSPNIPAFSFRLPFVIPIFDLNHRLQPEFPEMNGETNLRDQFYINTCKIGRAHV